MAVSRLAAQLSQWSLFGAHQLPLVNRQTVRYMNNKHWSPKWKKLRAAKMIKVELPNYQEDVSTFSDERRRSEMKKRGMQPPRPWVERQFFLSATGGVIEAYVPPEGDGKRSIVSAAGAKQKIELVEKKSKSMMAIRKIKSFEEDFTTAEFAKFAQDIYVKAHTYMAQKQRKKLREFVTEKAYPEMVYNTHRKTIHWKFLNSLEPPRVVHARNVDVLTKENLFSQITVRFHTQQQLTVYDRFGRLMYGSEILAKDVLEYVVFEKNISNVYGTWRIHHKIIPDWMPKRDMGQNTFIKVEETPEPSQDDAVSKAIIEDESQPPTRESKLATA